MKRKNEKLKVSKLIAMLAALLIMFGVSPAVTNSKIDERRAEIDLSTNMVCGMAVRIIEKALNKVDGVINAEVDPETKKAIVTYDDSKTSLRKLEKAITSVGYDANDKTGDPKAYEKLPDCCKIK